MNREYFGEVAKSSISIQVHTSAAHPRTALGNLCGDDLLHRRGCQHVVAQGRVHGRPPALPEDPERQSLDRPTGR